jgi:hypothetical protein
MPWVLVSDATGVNYNVQEHPKEGYILNGLIDNAIKFETQHGAKQMQSVLTYVVPVSLVPMEIKSKSVTK